MGGNERGGGNATKPYSCNSPQKYTEPSLCLRTNGRSGSSKNNGEGKYTWPLPTHTHAQTHTHTQSHIPLVHFTHMVNKKFIILMMGLQWGEGDTGNSIWLFIHHIANRCISAAGTTSGPLGQWPLMLTNLDLLIFKKEKKKKKVYKSCHKNQRKKVKLVSVKPMKTTFLFCF